MYGLFSEKLSIDKLINFCIYQTNVHSEINLKSLTDGPARTITLFDGDEPDVDPCDDITLEMAAVGSASMVNVATVAAADVEAPAFVLVNCLELVLPISNTEKDDGNRFNGVSVETHSDNEDFLFFAKTAAVTDSIAAATFRGVTIICGRTVAICVVEDSVIDCCCC